MQTKIQQPERPTLATATKGSQDSSYIYRIPLAPPEGVDLTVEHTELKDLAVSITQT